jgi:hypothetical protein
LLHLKLITHIQTMAQIAALFVAAALLPVVVNRSSFEQLGLGSSRPRKNGKRQGKPWPPGPLTWAAVISLDRPLGLADNYVTTKLNLQSTKYTCGESRRLLLKTRPQWSEISNKGLVRLVLSFFPKYHRSVRPIQKDSETLKRDRTDQDSRTGPGSKQMRNILSAAAPSPAPIIPPWIVHALLGCLGKVRGAAKRKIAKRCVFKIYNKNATFRNRRAASVFRRAAAAQRGGPRKGCQPRASFSRGKSDPEEAFLDRPRFSRRALE